jgi:hypothetical protein
MVSLETDRLTIRNFAPDDWQALQALIVAYHRVTWHANAHIWQIWCLCGAMGTVDHERFPRQFWH